MGGACGSASIGPSRACPLAGQPVGVGIPATVVRIGAMDVNGVTVVDVTVGPADGPELAIAAANGRVALVVQPMGS